MNERDRLAEEYDDRENSCGYYERIQEDFKAGWDAHEKKAQGLVEAIEYDFFLCYDTTDQKDFSTVAQAFRKALAQYKGEDGE